ncbi:MULTISPECIES: zinc finger domain-containing protein [unclassified Brevibacterium]|uniref:zinc finger domain-containing protein n=1 Tax=unclassified Brevibacterium TaxID=2614124 RepID=UPI0035266119
MTTRLAIGEGHKRVESGYFDRSLGVYGKAGTACTRCGETVRSSTIAGRTSHWCPACQKPQRRY